MTRKSWHLNRRDLLKGVGVALALPYLNAMEGIAKAATTTAVKQLPKRFVGSYIAYGVYMPDGGSGIPNKNPDGTYQQNEWSWWPCGQPGPLSFNKSSEPFKELKDSLTYLRGLDHKGGHRLGGHSSADVFLTGAYMGDVEKTNNISIDQLMAKHLGYHTRYDSLVLGTEGGTGSYMKAKTLSHRGPGKAIPSMHKPQEIFNRLFTPYGDKGIEQVRVGLKRDASVLDLLMEDSKSFHRRLGVEDREKMDEYLESVRETEKRVERNSQWTHTPLPSVDTKGMNFEVNHGGRPADYIRVMYDLIYLAFVTDQTRLATFMTESEYSQDSELWNYANYALGYKGATHDIAHKKPADFSGQWDLWRNENHAYFLKRLAATKEGSGTMLDNTMVLYGSAHPHDSHSGFNYPLQLSGGKNMGFKHGQLHEFVGDSKVPLTNLFVTMLNAMDIPAEKFADSSGTLNQLLRA